MHVQGKAFLEQESPRGVEEFLRRALGLRASDIHLEPQEQAYRLRYRIDGLLRQGEELTLKKGAALLSQLKLLAAMDIAERRLPQDGRFTRVIGGQQVDLRVATMPTLLGEKLVVRLLANRGDQLSLEALQLEPANLQLYEGLLNLASGMVLLTGPTGCGKTTSLYAALNRLNTKEKHIITIEDPVEYQLTGITQVAVNRTAGLTFATGLRSALRQDPDIIMVGEIRDKETAAIAVQAALTGHLVFATLHTNSAVGTIYRLVDMGLEAYLLAACLKGAMAQRLVRAICPKCKTAYRASAQEEAYLAAGGAILYRGTGCDHCGGTGYYGRLPVQEVLVFSEALLEAFMKGASKGQLEAIGSGFTSLYEDGKNKVLAGKTTVEEVLRQGLLREGSLC